MSARRLEAYRDSSLLASEDARAALSVVRSILDTSRPRKSRFLDLVLTICDMCEAPASVSDCEAMWACMCRAIEKIVAILHSLTKLRPCKHEIRSIRANGFSARSLRSLRGDVPRLLRSSLLARVLCKIDSAEEASGSQFFYLRKVQKIVDDVKVLQP